MYKECILEETRIDKIQSLGFLCYNLYVDKILSFPEMEKYIKRVGREFDYLLLLRQSLADEDSLRKQNEKVAETIGELGCACYNLYVDSRMLENSILSLCSSISTISNEISNEEIFNAENTPLTEDISNDYQEFEYEEKTHKNTTQSKLKVTCPYGMEPIPDNFKKCVCGYKNKSEASFCGKCGAKLS